MTISAVLSGFSDAVEWPGIRVGGDRCHVYRPIDNCPGMPRKERPPRAVMISTTSVTM